MNIKQAYDHIQKARPKVLHLSGKTSTGKSTFSNQLHEALGYKIIELDKIVHSIIDKQHLEDEGQVFIEIYKRRNRIDLINSFVHAVKEKIAAAQAKGYSIILDGAVANIQTLEQLLDEIPGTLIVYLHPASLTNYYQNLANRFKTATLTSNAGLPTKLWAMIDKAEFTHFCSTGEISPVIQQALERYALASQDESLRRMEALKVNFNNLIVVDI